MSTRIDRISEEVMKALAEALRSVKDPRVQNAMVSVVHCDVTNDLRYAKCYISVLGSEQQASLRPDGCAARSATRSSCATRPSWCSSSTSRSRAVRTSRKCCMN